MTRTIYIIIGGDGSYSDRFEKPLLAFTNKQDATLVHGCLEQIAKAYRFAKAEFPPALAWDAPERTRALKYAEAQAAVCGVDLFDDYEIVECPLRDVP